MDIKTTEDRAVSTECNSIADLKQSVSCNGLTKTEKKKSENKKLKKKLNETEEQNEKLTKLIADKSNEISELKISIKSLNEVINSVPIEELRANSSIASAKLLELSKKNRQLKLDLETAKNRLTKRNQQVQRLEKDLQMMEEQNKEMTKNSNPAYGEEMQSKLSALQQKLFETRNKNVELTTQLKLAQKCLQQEIGESFNLNLLAGQVNSASWRGRAQQILHLQQRVKELQEKLDGNKKNELNSGNIFQYSDATLSSNGSFGSNERPCVRKTEIQHRAKVDNLEKEITNLKSELEDYRSKILALKVRNKTLNDEISRHKSKANSLEEQTDFNNFNVASMNDRLNHQKLYYEKLLNERAKETENLLKEKHEISIERDHLHEKISELENLVKSRDQSINELNLLEKKLEQDLRAISGDFLFSCRDLRKEEFICILDGLEAEKNSLLDLNKTLNERLTQERYKNDTLCEQVSKQKIRISRLESKVRDLERELELQSEKKKRTQRIAEYTTNLSTAGSTTSIGSFIFENTCTVATVNGNSEKSNEDIGDLKNRLELATEKVTMLKEKLDYINTEKENDVKTFHEIITSSKNVLLEMIKAQHQSTSPGD